MTANAADRDASRKQAALESMALERRNRVRGGSEPFPVYADPKNIAENEQIAPSMGMMGGMAGMGRRLVDGVVAGKQPPAIGGAPLKDAAARAPIAIGQAGEAMNFYSDKEKQVAKGGNIQYALGLDFKMGDALRRSRRASGSSRRPTGTPAS